MFRDDAMIGQFFQSSRQLRKPWAVGSSPAKRAFVAAAGRSPDLQNREESVLAIIAAVGSKGRTSAAAVRTPRLPGFPSVLTWRASIHGPSKPSICRSKPLALAAVFQ